MRLTGLPPVYDKNTEIMILGSFPSAKALASQQYYGNPQNHFWRLMGKVLDEELVPMTYEERIAALLKHRIGLWDVFHSCEREGSLDADICEGQVNDFSALPELKIVFLNGKLAGSHAPLLNDMGIRTNVLPSSSTASLTPFERKLKDWRRIRLAKKGVLVKRKNEK